MAKAVYSPENIGHFGLAFDYYAHFTSPIRRYPDLIVHRILTDYLDKKASYKTNKLEIFGKHCSAQEKKAAEAERASIKYKQVEFMSERLGEYFNGIISGLTDWGIYVELDDNKCEGMLSLKNLPGDNYYFDEKNYVVTGMRTKKQFRLGDHIRVAKDHTSFQIVCQGTISKIGAAHKSDVFVRSNEFCVERGEGTAGDRTVLRWPGPEAGTPLQFAESVLRCPRTGFRRGFQDEVHLHAPIQGGREFSDDFANTVGDETDDEDPVSSLADDFNGDRTGQPDGDSGGCRPADDDLGLLCPTAFMGQPRGLQRQGDRLPW